MGLRYANVQLGPREAEIPRPGRSRVDAPHRARRVSLRLITKSVWTNPGNRGKRLRKTIQAVSWQVQKRATGSVRVLRLPNGTRFSAHPDCVVSSNLIYADWPEH